MAETRSRTKKATTASEAGNKEKEVIQGNNTAEENEDRVPFFAELKDDPNDTELLIIVNGKSYLIQRGREVMVPRNVAMAYYDSQRQKKRLAELKVDCPQK